MCSRHRPFLLLLLLLSSTAASTDSQCSALLSSFHSSTNPSTWQPGTDCCRNWLGVTCSSSFITSLDLTNLSISGPIGPSLFHLTSLRSLNLAYNAFYRMPIPSSFGNLTRLTHLNLSSCGFTGQIPTSLASLTNLVSLDLSDLNSGSLQPTPNFETLVRNLTGLRELYLTGVNISESINYVAHVLARAAPDITAIDLAGCSLSGPIGSPLSKLSNLSVLVLDQNELNSTVPGFLANFSSLTVLRLANTGLRGFFPAGVFTLKHLTELDMSSNPMLSGLLPEFAYGSKLSSLMLSGTNFSGRLPSSIGNMKSLTYLDVRGCFFSGVIPVSIAYLPRLLRLDLSNNNFSSAIPAVMPAMISEIILSNNLLTGSIPASFGELLHLTLLDLSDNSLSGPVHKSLFTLPLLRILILDRNNLSGQIHEFRNASSLLLLVDLSNNFLSGEVPTSFYQLSGLNLLNLAWNNFNGTIQMEWFRGMNDLSSLDLSYNSFWVESGDGNSSIPYPVFDVLNLASCNLTEIPRFLKYQQLPYQMEILDLSNNKIGGTIPRWIWNVRNLNLSNNQLTSVEGPLTLLDVDFPLIRDFHSNMLQGPIPVPGGNVVILDYSNNKFSSIPSEVASWLNFAVFFSLANNQITGEIPPSICNALFLEVLDFSGNFLSGPIPPCLLENDNNLSVLNLGSNKLRSSIPLNISKKCVLRTLDLNGNHLEGKLPSSLTNCGVLEVLDLGNNQIVDTFPFWLSNISSLRILVLNNNEFYGPVLPPLESLATDFYTFPLLQILDLSSNHFNGILPLELFKSLKGLMVDLHQNYSILRFQYMILNPCYYYDAVTVITKGFEYTLVKILSAFTAMDLSNNRFTGNIPEVIGELQSLHTLNISQNALTGQIPKSVGNMIQLESLDLSRNRLSGVIPQGLVLLTFLSILNLSNNNLVGRIPTGGQLSTFPDTSYQGNIGLCGTPLSNQCSYAEAEPPITDADSLDSTYVIGMALFSGLGYGIGIALVVMLKNPSLWRRRRRNGRR